MALGRQGERHPLAPVLTDIKRYCGDVWVDLEEAKPEEGRQFVDALLDAEPNRLGEDFREALFRHTKGHPLFTVELLQAMREREDLVRDAEDRWLAGPALDWGALPARVEGVIEERVGRLEDELRDTLTIASVEGEDFTAQVVARVRQADERGLVRQLSQELDRKHRLISVEGIQRLGQQRLSLYRFRHHLLQKYLYSSLDQVERTYLHEDMGNVLEELYEGQTGEVAIQLARHFEAAGLEEKARHYLYQAGERARRQYAHEEAIAYLSRALELTPATEYATRFDILLAREKVHEMRGERQAQQADLVALQELAEVLDAPSTGPSSSSGRVQQAEVAARWAKFGIVTSNYPAAITAAQQAVKLASEVDAIEIEAEGRRRWGVALMRQGDYTSAGAELERALTLAREAGLTRIAAVCLQSLGVLAAEQGDYAGDLTYSEQALALYREVGDRRGEIWMLHNLGCTARDTGDFARARDELQHALNSFAPSATGGVRASRLTTWLGLRITRAIMKPLGNTASRRCRGPW